MFEKWFEKVNGAMGGGLYRYGRFLAEHPWKFIIVISALDILLSIGMIRLEMVNDPFYLYTPINNQAKRDQDSLLDMYPDYSKTNYHSHSLISFGRFGEILVRDKNGGNILTESGLSEVDRIFRYITHQTNVTDKNGTMWTYYDLCARKQGHCVIDGVELLDNREKLYKGEVTYPEFIQNFSPIFLPIFLGKATVVNGFVTAAKDIRFRINIIDDERGLAWEQEFKKTAEALHSETVDIFYSYSVAIVDEGNLTIENNIMYFVGSMVLMIIFATVATLGGDCLSNRSHLGQAGVVSAIMGISAAFGLLSAAGLELVNIAGIAPFLVFGISLNTMYIMMSGQADAVRLSTVEERIGYILRTSGVSITITSFSSLLAFSLGASTTYPGIRFFCVYTAVSIFLSYVNFMTFFPACMAIHERRIENYRHSITCQIIRPKVVTEENRDSVMCLGCSSGSKPKSREDVTTLIEKISTRVAQKLFAHEWIRPVFILLYMVYIAVSVWGAVHFKEGVLIQQLSHEDSYFYKHAVIILADYEIEMLISFDIMEPMNYSDPTAQNNMLNLIIEAKQDSSIRNDFHVSWFDAYRMSDHYNDSSEISFVKNLKEFLDIYSFFRNDVIFNEDVSKILASRFYVRAHGTDDWVALAALMVRMRNVVDTSPLPVITFAPHYRYFAQLATLTEQFIQILIVSAVAVFVATFILMPRPVLALLTTFSVASIIVGLTGFMYYIGLTLNSMTMLSMILSVGFSIDYSIHIVHAYMQVEGETKEEKIKRAIEIAGGPMFNGAISTFVGVALLIAAESYIFFTFFRVISIVVTLAAAHALIILPIALSLFGPLDDTAAITLHSMKRRASDSVFHTTVNPDSARIHTEKLPRRQISDNGVLSIPRAKINSNSSNDSGFMEKALYY